MPLVACARTDGFPPTRRRRERPWTEDGAATAGVWQPGAFM